LLGSFRKPSVAGIEQPLSQISAQKESVHCTLPSNTLQAASPATGTTNEKDKAVAN